MKTLALILNLLVCQSLIASVDFDCKEFLSFEQTVEPAKALDVSSALMAAYYTIPSSGISTRRQALGCAAAYSSRRRSMDTCV